MELKNNLFDMRINENGALTRLVLAEDEYKANLVLASRDEKWVPQNKQWGLGFVTSGHNRVAIDNCKETSVSGNRAVSVYSLSFEDTRFACVWDGDMKKSRTKRNLTVTVTRELRDDGLYEYFEFKNNSPKYAVLDEIGIYSSFRDTYKAGADSLCRRFNQHICVCGDLSFTEAQRQNANGKNACMITLEGSFKTYQIEEQNTSNVRGVIALVSKDIRIASGESVRYGRVITDCRDRNEFCEKLCAYTGCPIADYGVMTLQKGEKININVKKRGSLSEIRMDGETLSEKNGVYSYTPGEKGICEGIIKYGGRKASITYNITDNIKTLMEKRAAFIVKNQQLNDKSDPRYGAFMPYDTEEERIYKSEDIENIYHSIPDRNEARERHAMGAFLAIYSRLYGDTGYLPALERYRDFMLRCIVDENGDVWDCYLKQRGEKYYKNDIVLVQRELDMRSRKYNYAFATPFFIEMYLLTGDKAYADTALKIMARYYETNKTPGFMPDVSELKLETANADALNKINAVKKGVLNVVNEIKKTGGDYAADEVEYEHGTPSGRFKFLTEYYLREKDDSVLGIIGDELSRTLSFQGNQPHFNQNGIPVRHWDAFWFGKYELWGDTMPHWVGCQSAGGFCNYYLMTGDKKYIDMAKKIFMANFGLINKDGSAYNSYIFNEKTNGRQAGRYDPLSNDQDWIYYYYLKYCEKGVFKL